MSGIDKHFKLNSQRDAIYWYDGKLGEILIIPNGIVI